MGEVLDEVTRGEHVVAVPGAALRVLRQAPWPPARKWCGLPTPCRLLERVPGQGPFSVGGGVASVSMVLIVFGDQLDVAELLGGDVGDQVIERTGALMVTEVERLERVVQERRRLPTFRPAAPGPRQRPQDPDPTAAAAGRSGCDRRGESSRFDTFPRITSSATLPVARAIETGTSHQSPVPELDGARPATPDVPEQTRPRDCSQRTTIVFEDRSPFPSPGARPANRTRNRDLGYGRARAKDAHRRACVARQSVGPRWGVRWC